MSYCAADIEYFAAEHDHAIAVAKSVVHAWDLSRPEVLLESLRFLHEYVEEVAARK
jgi:hypothetical protein